ncbi:MAG: ABC transporter ATP-binding protein [Eubacteriales bacterium]|nr:ABC transporter ATP-binding protein [Eubacteriales bacterium]
MTEKRCGLIPTFRRLLVQIYRVSPGLFWLVTVLSACHSASWGVLAWFQQRFFDAAAGLAAGTAAFGTALLGLAGLAFANVLTQVLNGAGNYIYTPFQAVVTGKLSLAIHQKMGRIDPICFEDTKKLDDINRAEEGKNNAFWFVCNIKMLFTFYLPYFAVMGWYLFSLKPLLALSIVIIFVPTALSQIVRSRAFARLEDQSAPVRREYEYYEKCIADREFLKETRLLGGFYYFKKLYTDTLSLLNRLRFRASLRSTLFELGTRVVTIAGYGVILYMLFCALLAGEISVGAFSAVFANLGMLQGIMEEIVCRHMGSVARGFGAVKNYVRFLDLPDRTGDAASGGASVRLPDGGDIVFDNVSFSYPGAEKKSLDGVSFTVKEGETLAVVGENGAGKSTFVRLLCGMYTPDEGSVRRGGVDLRDAALPELRRNLSAVFQRFRRYQMTLGDNLSIAEGDFDAPREVLADAAARAGLDVSAFPAGFDTMLSREFNDDGEVTAELSGGQWQKVAIARAYCRGHRLIILDEPTAAIDPLEESRVYNRFAELARDKTAVIVTHRLGSVRLADRILVLADGRVAECGTHESLMAAGGEYARMFAAQQKWYE